MNDLLANWRCGMIGPAWFRRLRWAWYDYRTNAIRVTMDDVNYLLKEHNAAMTAEEARFKALLKSHQSCIDTLQDIAAMGKTKGCESARHRLHELGIDVPDYGSMT